MVLPILYFTPGKFKSICVDCFVLMARCMCFIHIDSELDIWSINQYLLKAHNVHRTLD